MNEHSPNQSSQSTEEPEEDVMSRPSLLRHPLAWRRARRDERIHRVSDQQLAWRVQDVLVGCGLSQDDYSVGGGRVFHIPQVISVRNGPAATLDIRMLAGQTPEDFVAHTSAMAYDLGVAEVRVVPLEVPLIRLELLSKPTHQRHMA
jgi:hypothetical protein